MWHPYVYAELLAAELEQVGASEYRWLGGRSLRHRQPLQPEYTRQLVDTIHDGSLSSVEWEEMPVFGLMQPKGGINCRAASRRRWKLCGQSKWS